MDRSLSVGSDGSGRPFFISTAEEAKGILPDLPFLAMFQIWNGWDGPDGVPYRHHLDPIDFSRFLSHMMLIERLPDGEFLYRVAGTHIVVAVGFDPTMKPLNALPDYVDKQSVAAAFQSTLDRRQPRFEHMTGKIFNKDWITYRRLLLPMVDDAGFPRFILGCVHGQATDP